MREVKGHSGQYVYYAKGKRSVDQTDLKGTFVCEQCEINFGHDDRFAVNFFRKRKFLVRRTEEFEVHNLAGKKGISKLLLSLAIRMHLYEITIGKEGLLGPLFEVARRIYLDADPPGGLVLLTVHYPLLIKLASPPLILKQDEFTVLQIFICGYQFKAVLQGPAIVAGEFDQLGGPEFRIAIDPSINGEVAQHLLKFKP